MTEQLVPTQTRRAIGEIVERPQHYSVEPDKLVVNFADLEGPNGSTVSYLVSPEALAASGIVPQLGSRLEATVPSEFDDYRSQPGDFTVVPEQAVAEG